MAQCAREGFYPSRHVPYGYRRQPVVRPSAVRYRLEPEPAETEIVREIFRLYINHGGAKLCEFAEWSDWPPLRWRSRTSQRRSASLSRSHERRGRG